MGDLQKTLNHPAAIGGYVKQLLVPGTKFISGHAYNKGAAGYLFLFDAVASVATGVSTGFFIWDLPASAERDLTFPAGYPRSMASGIFLALSTNNTSYVSTGANVLLDIQYG